jgi:hypothetical protein
MPKWLGSQLKYIIISLVQYLYGVLQIMMVMAFLNSTYLGLALMAVLNQFIPNADVDGVLAADGARL